MENQFANQKSKEKELYLSNSQCFKSYTIRSGTEKNSHCGGFFDNNSEFLQNNGKKLVAQQKHHWIHSFPKLSLSHVNNLNFQEEGSPGGKFSHKNVTKKEFLSPVIIKAREKNQIFEELLKTPQKDTKFFAKLLLKKYPSSPSEHQLNLSTGNDVKRRASDSINYTESSQIANKNVIALKSQGAVKMNFSSIHEGQEVFSFEPEDAESDIHYDIKIRRQTLMYHDQKKFEIKANSIQDKDVIYPPEQKFSEIKNLKFELENYFENKEEIQLFNKIKINFELLKNELRNFYDHRSKNPTLGQEPSFFKRIFSCSSRKEPRSDFCFLLFLNKINNKSSLSKNDFIRRSLKSLNIIFNDLVMLVSHKHISLSNQIADYKLQSAPIILLSGKNTENLEFLESKYSIGHSRKRKSYSILSLIMLIEFVQENIQIMHELFVLCFQKRCTFLELYLNAFSICLKEFKKGWHSQFEDSSKFSELKKFVNLSLFGLVSTIIEIPEPSQIDYRISKANQVLIRKQYSKLRDIIDKTDKTSLRAVV
jgi:hypothetical protein